MFPNSVADLGFIVNVLNTMHLQTGDTANVEVHLRDGVVGEPLHVTVLKHDEIWVVRW